MVSLKYFLLFKNIQLNTLYLLLYLSKVVLNIHSHIKFITTLGRLYELTLQYMLNYVNTFNNLIRKRN